MKGIFNKRKIKEQSGQSLVELAMSLTILITLLAGAFDFGSAFFDYIAMRDAAQEGAIFGSMDPSTTAAIVERVQQSSTKPLDFGTFVESCDVDNPSGICVTFTGPQCVGNHVTVTVRYHYDLTMPFISAILGSETIPLHATVTNVILTPKCP